MRLLNVETKKLKEFFSNIPPYAILSHTWEDEEITFQDLTQANGADRGKSGWSKVEKSCEIAARDGWSWIWIDTCCIDKSSSNELSEAINSMFQWYQQAVVCYAYLGDYSISPRDGMQPIPFERSRWFTRGWTLQELIAPRDVWFYDQTWTSIGSRTILSYHIELATGAPLADLLNFRSCSIAKRMSWAARRQTTREEDLAYCLLGLFDINMPLLYGEGSKAYLRLQLEIMKYSDDKSILVWESSDNVSGNDAGMLLAPFPGCFEHFNRVYDSNPSTEHQSDYSVTNKGLSIELQLYIKAKHTDELASIYPELQVVAPLDCVDEATNDRIALQLTMYRGSLTPGYGGKRLLIPFDPEVLLADSTWTTRRPKRVIIQNSQSRDPQENIARNYGRTVSFRHPPEIAIEAVYRAYGASRAFDTSYDAHELANNCEIVEPYDRVTLYATTVVVALSLQNHSDVLLVVRRMNPTEPPRLALLHGLSNESPHTMMRRAKAIDMTIDPLGCAMMQLELPGSGVLLSAQIKPICGAYGELQSAICIEYHVNNAIMSDAAKLFRYQGYKPAPRHTAPRPHSYTSWGGPGEPDGGMDDYDFPDFDLDLPRQ